jgi:exodeoxyribonuclease-3
MRLVTWNINSIRLRQDLVLRLIAETDPDVICLQETKATDDQFPAKPFFEAGYEHIALNGIKAYHGVAILSRLPMMTWEKRDWCGKVDGRHLIAELPGGIELHNFYIPAGGDVPDPAENEKFAHKLQFVDEVTDWWRQARSADRPMVLVGDLNIAPLESDVWSHKQLLDVVSHTPVEVDKLTAMQESIGWVDAVRAFIPPEEKLFSWWSYRARDWRASDRGRRLDHIWVTPPLKPALAGAQILKDARGWDPKPSDHAPVIVDLAA